MFTNTLPLFKKGCILKQEMLESLRDYPKNFLDLIYSNYSNGIIEGCSVEADDKYICINKGIIKYKERMFVLLETFKLNYDHTNKEMIIKIKFKEESIEPDFNKFIGEIFLDNNLELAENEFELGRFKLREGAKLRSNYKNFLDFSTEYNMINIINVKHSHINNSTLSPLITKEFFKELSCKSSNDFYDISFLMTCVNSDKVSREMIYYYLKNKLGIEDKNYSNKDIYTYMSKIIKLFSNQSKNIEMSPTKSKRPNKIIVD